MSGSLKRIRCRCGGGKVSVWDGKCGKCRKAPHPRIAFYQNPPAKETAR